MSGCDQVLEAVKLGCQTVDEIARKTGLPKVRVGTYITRLRRRYLVKAKDKRRPRSYGVTAAHCELAEAWK